MKELKQIDKDNHLRGFLYVETELLKQKLQNFLHYDFVLKHSSAKKKKKEKSQSLTIVLRGSKRRHIISADMIC